MFGKVDRWKQTVSKKINDLFKKLSGSVCASVQKYKRLFNSGVCEDVVFV